MQTAAWNEGFDARKRGDSEGSCPFDPLTIQRKDWFAGWHRAGGAALKLLFSNDWMRRRIGRDPDVETEAGAIHPEAPFNRFTVEHGVVHDRVIGRHINVTPDSIAAEGSEKLRDYLIALASHRI